MKISWLVMGIIGTLRRTLVAHLLPHGEIIAAYPQKFAAGAYNSPLNEGPEFHMR